MAVELRKQLHDLIHFLWKYIPSKETFKVNGKPKGYLHDKLQHKNYRKDIPINVMVNTS